jgi:hypothetical protein
MTSGTMSANKTTAMEHVVSFLMGDLLRAVEHPGMIQSSKETGEKKALSKLNNHVYFNWLP